PYGSVMYFPLILLFFPAALSEPEICYVLDGILFLYGIILTALYCRVKVCSNKLNSNTVVLSHSQHSNKTQHIRQ
uniref:Uncharacterized protein n=1 Tax=Nothobranchius furzeri TaxID=105023 RepID=A0A8C6PUE5_NOTFU